MLASIMSATPATDLWTALSLADAREAVRFCNSYNRLDTVIDLAWRMEPADWLTLLGEEWESCDDVAKHTTDAGGPLWDTPFEDLAWSPLQWRHHMMTADEVKALDALPPIVTVWRGCYAFNKRGFSWSLDRATAEGFPFLHRYRQDSQPLLVRGEVHRDHVMALKLDRNESEVVVVPSRVKIRAISHARQSAMT
jgi:hypothetical protein